VRAIRLGQAVRRGDDRPQPQLARQPGDGGQLCSQNRPLVPVPVRRADRVRAVDGHDTLARRADRALGEVHDPRAPGIRLAHQSADLLAAFAQRVGIAGVLVDGQLRDGESHALTVPCFRHDVSRWSRTEVPEGRGVGLASLGGAGAYPALEVPVRCHRGLPRLGRRFPSNLTRGDRAATAT
jgi:hypothetical protein